MRSRGELTGWALVLMLAASGCGDAGGPDLDPLPIPEGCNPLASDRDCLLPFPSDFFLSEDSSLPSGQRVTIAEKYVVHSSEGHPADPTRVHPADGFSHISQILALFPSGVDDANLVFHTGDVFASLTPASPTLILEAETGEPVVHFAELDPRAGSDDRRAFLIRPLVRLKNATRYVVAIHSLQGHDGKAVLAPEGFRRIRDGQASDHDILGPLADRYEAEVFPVLEDFGVARESLQLAWDFTVETQENVTRDMLFVRSEVIDTLSRTPPAVTITEVTTDVGAHIDIQVDGTMRVPLFMEDAEPGARLNRDANGDVALNADAEVPFTLLIPRSVTASGPEDPPARLLQFGHGFFGFRAKGSGTGDLDEFLDQYRFVLLGVDWWGMSASDVGEVIDAIANRPAEMVAFTDRVHQGMANTIAAATTARGPLLEQLDLGIGPDPLYDVEQIYYLGYSQGQISGGLYVAMAPHVERAVLGVGGAGFSFIMFRSRSFATFLGFIELYFPDSLDQQKFTAMTQTTFDRIDPITYAPFVTSDTYPGCPPSRRVLMHLGIGDTQVPNLATRLHARAMGLSLLMPAPREVPLLDPVTSPFDGSALVEFDFGIEPEPGILAMPPEEGNEVHDGVRELEAAGRQIDLFLRVDGSIQHTCEGACDPE